MYVRFVVGTDRELPRTQTGVVTELRLLKESGDLPDYEVEHVDEIFEWMNAAYRVPPFEGRNWSPDAISWFKDSAQDLIAVFRDINAILEQYGRPVRMLRTAKPGMILYEDDEQIVAQSNQF